MDRGLPQPPVQVRALRMLDQYFPSSMERKFIRRWLEPRAVKAQRRAEQKAMVRASPVERARAKLKSESTNARRKADDAFSILVRTMGTRIYSDGQRRGHCVTCPEGASLKMFKELQCGHWIRRKHWGTRFHLWNCHPQCETCNRPDRGNGREPLHEAYIRASHGPTAPDALWALAKLNKRRPREFEFVAMEKEFERLRREYLAQEGGLGQ